MTNQKALNERYDKVVDDFYEKNYFITAEVAKLGRPSYRKDIPTAVVEWNPQTQKINYAFNEDFFNKLEDYELFFVMAHEANHVVRCHPYLYGQQVNKWKSEGKTAEEINKLLDKLNKAADCVINDYLVNVCGLSEPQGAPLCRGKFLVGVDCEDFDVLQVFNMMPDSVGGSDGFDNLNWESFGSGGAAEQLRDIVEDYKESSMITQGESALVDELSKKISNISAGKAPSTNIRPILKSGSRTINWAKLLFKFVTSKKVEEKWNRQPRKMTSIYPDVILPRVKQREKIKVFVAIDASSSISYEAISVFVEVAKNTPKDFDVDAITFNTECFKYDVRKDKNPIGFGGTNFSIIERYIQENFNKYPDIVVVLTDGHGTQINPEHPDRWCWLLYGHYSTRFIEKMKHFVLKSLIK